MIEVEGMDDWLQRKMETAIDYTKRVLRRGGRAKKSLGQNFLIDDSIIEDIVWQGIPEGDMPLVEIGSGPGGLTRALVERTDRLWAVELDTEKIEILEKEFLDYPLHLIHMDALKLNLQDLWGKEKGWLVGNLPYYITNPLLMHFLEQGESLKGLTIMVQKEVGNRMMARPGSKEYGILSIAVQLSAEVHKLFDVPPAAFWPPPKVTSTVLRLDIRSYPGLEIDSVTFFQVVRAAFGQRRKTLLNALTAGLNIPKPEMSEILRIAGIDEGLRPEKLSIPEYEKIAKLIKSR